MEVIRADVLGFCGGVKRAVILAEQVFQKNSLKKDFKFETVGDLIHNKREIERLEKLGLSVKEEAADVTEGATVLIRAHGASKSDYNVLREKNATIIEGICPLVRDIRNMIFRYVEEQYYILLTGDAEHAEVRGLSSFMQGSGTVIESVAEAEDVELPADRKLVLLSQSTWKREKLLEVEKILRRRRPDLVFEDTICQATLDRQNALREMLPKVDAVVVIGGRHSANTRELFDIAEASGLPSWYCSHEDEIPPEVAAYKRVGISAGASSPDWLIDRIERKILEQWASGPRT